jgi:outer membrane protein OmpA-like peptidoglycan-associated protein
MKACFSDFSDLLLYKGGEDCFCFFLKNIREVSAMIKRILAIGLCMGLGTGTLWAGGPGTTNANFLKAGQGVRPIAMGESYIALGDGLDTLYWNPSGLHQLSSPTATFTHSFWFQDIGTEYLAYGMPLGPLGAVGGGLTFLHAGTIDQTTEDQFGNYRETAGTASASSIAFIGTYAQKLSRLMLIDSPFLKDVLLGASLRIVNETIADKNVFGGGVDVGAIWRQTEDIAPVEISTASGSVMASDGKYAVRDRGWRAGFTAQNVGATTDSLMPINFRAGAGYVARNVFTPYGRGTVALDVLIPIDNDVKVSAGAEYAHISENTEFAVRAGYKIGPEIKDLDSTAGLTAGLGIAIQAALIRYQVDYAFVPYGELGTTHRASLTLAFLPNENPVVAPLKSPRVVAPLKEEPPVITPAAPAKQETKAPAPASPAPAAPAAVPAVVPEAPAAAPAPAKTAPAQPLKEALDRLQGRINVGLSPGVTFKKGESQFADKSKPTLDQVGKLLERYPESRLVVSGFDPDKALALARAQAVVKYLNMTYRIHADAVTTQAGNPAQQPKNSSIAFEAELK